MKVFVFGVKIEIARVATDIRVRLAQTRDLKLGQDAYPGLERAAGKV